MNWLLGNSGTVCPVDHQRPHRHRTLASMTAARPKRTWGPQGGAGLRAQQSCPTLAEEPQGTHAHTHTHTLGLGFFSSFLICHIVPELVASPLCVSLLLPLCLCFPSAPQFPLYTEPTSPSGTVVTELRACNSFMGFENIFICFKIRKKKKREPFGDNILIRKINIFTFIPTES